MIEGSESGEISVDSTDKKPKKSTKSKEPEFSDSQTETIKMLGFD
jgi:hypothetical protein